VQALLDALHAERRPNPPLMVQLRAGKARKDVVLSSPEGTSVDVQWQQHLPVPGSG
jgi:hypothetical protein